MDEIFASLSVEQLEKFLEFKRQEETRKQARIQEQEPGVLVNNDIPLVPSGDLPVVQHPVEKQPFSGSSSDLQRSNQESGSKEVGVEKEDKETSSSSSNSGQGGLQISKEGQIRDQVLSGTELVTEELSTKTTEPAVVGREQVVEEKAGDTNPPSTSTNPPIPSDNIGQVEKPIRFGSDPSSSQSQVPLVLHEPKESGAGSKRKEDQREEIGVNLVQPRKKATSASSSITQAPPVPPPVPNTPIGKRTDEERIESPDTDEETRVKSGNRKKKTTVERYKEVLADEGAWSNGRFTGDVNGKRETNQTVASLKKKFGLPDDYSSGDKPSWTVHKPRSGSGFGPSKSSSSSSGGAGATSSSSSSSSASSFSGRPKRTPKPNKDEPTIGEIDELVAEKVEEFSDILRNRSQVPLLVLHRSFDIYKPDSADYLPGGRPTGSGTCNICAEQSDTFCGGCTALSKNPTDKSGRPRQIHWLCLKCQSEHTASFAFQLAECAYEVVIREENNWVKG